ncbi:ROK family protein [Rubrobacter aplysinae]|uniref:ROK family protein n=1 Tax=Rubrobacter aplysinae TaxID=909625 RepID=UPI00069DC781|nr:ROK family protein [Rubrobacter aplysinae]
MNAIGVDVGGTKIAAGLVSPQGKLLNEARYPTANDPEKLLDSLARAVEEAADDSGDAGDGVEAVCLAVPGLLLASEDKVVFSPNLHAIEGLPLKSELQSRTGLTVTVENDASAAAWGEFVFGAGSEVENLVFLTLGTGVGGGVILDGRLLRGSQGAGGELGHTTLHATGPRCNCGNRGCFEIMASGLAIERRARQIAAEKPGSDLARVVTDPRGFSGEQVTELATEEDALALSVMRETGTWLGIGIAGFVNVFNPEIVAVGGGVAEAGDLILEPARREVRLRARSPSRDLAEIKPATLGARSGLLGAAALARDASGATVLDAG